MDKIIDYKIKQQKIEELKEEKKKHLEDIKALYDSIIQEKERELEAYGKIKCEHEIVFHYTDEVYDVLHSKTSPRKLFICVLCNEISGKIYNSENKIVIEDMGHIYTTQEVMEVTKLMRAALATLPSLDDKEMIKEVLNSVLRGEEIIRK